VACFFHSCARMNLSTVYKALRNPELAFTAARALGKGHYYRVKFKLLGRRIVIGRRFRVIGRFDIRGPGTVIMGDDCHVISSFLQVTTAWTHAPDAVIKIGDRALLTGTRIGCVQRIEIGDGAGLSDARIMDGDFHSIEVTDGHRGVTGGRKKPIIMGRNVWLGAGSMILKGVNIGDHAVVGAGAVVASNVPEYSVVFGNPARVVWRVPKPAAPQAQLPEENVAVNLNSSKSAEEFVNS
jgi:acetyltransferase-like isoleucine patch superfamily enzyme